MSTGVIVNCPQCREPTQALFEGYCEPCYSDNQAILDEHNLTYDRWQNLTDAQREDEIKTAL